MVLMTFPVDPTPPAGEDHLAKTCICQPDEVFNKRGGALDQCIGLIHKMKNKTQIKKLNQ